MNLFDSKSQKWQIREFRTFPYLGDRTKHNRFGPNIFFSENSALTTTVSSTVEKNLSMTSGQTNMFTTRETCKSGLLITTETADQLIGPIRASSLNFEVA